MDAEVKVEREEEELSEEEEGLKVEMKEQEKEEEEVVVDPIPDIHAFFSHYNSIYFDDALGSCVVKWSSCLTSCTGVCCYLPGGACEICLSGPLLKFCKTSDIKNTLLHEMIHAFLWTRENNRDHSEHGPSFQAIMNAINSSAVIDSQRPSAGYNVTIYHDFHGGVDSFGVHQWICDSCGDCIKRSMNKKPSTGDCVEHKGKRKSCGNTLCHWHKHKMSCKGNYMKVAEPPGYKKKKKSSKDAEKATEDNPLGLTLTIRDNTQISQKPEGKKESSDNIPKVETPHLSMTPEVPKRARTSQPWKMSLPICTKRKRYDECKNDFAVISKWLNYYESEGMHEDVKPLINKRTERRKKMKLMKIQMERGSIRENMDEAFARTSCSEGSNTKYEPFGGTSTAHATDTSHCPHTQIEAMDCTSHARTRYPNKRTNEAQSLHVGEIAKQELTQCHAKEFLDGAAVETFDPTPLYRSCNSGCGTSMEVQFGALKAISHKNSSAMDEIIDLSD